MCAQADAFHGEVLDALGMLTGETIVLMWSDHGEQVRGVAPIGSEGQYQCCLGRSSHPLSHPQAFEARQVLKDTFREPSSRVPLIFAGPGIAVGREVQSPVSLIDVWPTLANLTGIAPPPNARGFSLVPQMCASAGPDGCGRGDHPGAVVGEFFAENSDTGAFMLRVGDWKYIAYGHSFPWFAHYKPQLFNVTNDPLENTDLAASNPAVVAELDAQLVALLGESYEAIDATVMANDQLIWRKYIAANKTDAAVRKILASTYKGFNDSDWAKVQTWLAATPLPLSQ